MFFFLRIKFNRLKTELKLRILTKYLHCLIKLNLKCVIKINKSNFHPIFDIIKAYCLNCELRDPTLNCVFSCVSTSLVKKTNLQSKLASLPNVLSRLFSFFKYSKMLANSHKR